MSHSSLKGEIRFWFVSSFRGLITQVYLKNMHYTHLQAAAYGHRVVPVLREVHAVLIRQQESVYEPNTPPPLVNDFNISSSVKS